MSAAFSVEHHQEYDGSGHRLRMPPELKATIIEVAESERALDNLISYSSRLHQSNIDHDPLTCLVCFGAA